MSTETPNHPDAVCSLRGLPCHELGEELIERDAMRSRLGMLMAAAALRVEVEELRAKLAEAEDAFRAVTVPPAAPLGEVARG